MVWRWRVEGEGRRVVKKMWRIGMALGRRADMTGIVSFEGFKGY